jgi:hypothetical protein
MPMARLLNGSAFSPDDITILSAAFEDALRTLGLTDRADPATELVAQKIFALAQQGERDPVRLSEGALKALEARPHSTPDVR